MSSVPDTAHENVETEPAALRRARLVVAYDGSGFHGFAEADATPTVMGELRAAMKAAFGGVVGWGVSTVVEFAGAVFMILLVASQVPR